MIVVSSAKTQDFSPVEMPLTPTLPLFLEETRRHLLPALHQYDLAGLRALMGISAPLAEQTRAQFADFSLDMPPNNGKPALLAYGGEVFRRMAPTGFTAADLHFAQQHLRILSGLYGILRPLDLIQPHRLEMGYALANLRGETLYAFWSRLVTDHLNQALAQERHPLLINLASAEYIRVVEKKRLQALWLDVQFQEDDRDRLKTVAIHAKRARGLMAAFLIRNRVEQPEIMQRFDAEGYRFRPELSTNRQYVFTRPVS